jgi:hypothetical protein
MILPKPLASHGDYRPAAEDHALERNPFDLRKHVRGGGFVDHISVAAPETVGKHIARDEFDVAQGAASGTRPRIAPEHHERRDLGRLHGRAVKNRST